jgi:hypothetical protein
LGLASLAELGLKHTEVSEFQAVAFTQLVHNLVKKLLNDLLDLDATVPGSVGNSVDQFFLRNRGHAAALEVDNIRWTTDLVTMTALKSKFKSIYVR